MRSTLLTLLCLAAAGAMPAAEATTPPAVTLAGTAQLKLNSARIGQTCDLFVSLPADYVTSGKRYPVLYVLDGWHFPPMAFFQNNNIYSERMPPVIMVNIGHVPAADAMRLRLPDFTTRPMAHWPKSGRAADFLYLIEHEFVP